jgi:hypothetical protein
MLLSERLTYSFPKLNVEWRWRPLEDDDTGLIFTISPVFGSLQTFPAAMGCLPLWLSVLGCTIGRRGFLGWESDIVDPPANIRHRHNAPNVHQLEWLNAIERALSRRPLILVINQMELQAASCSATPAISQSLETMMAALDSAWSYSSELECLPRALFRYQWLRARGLYPKLYVGVHVPTDLMHSWVSLDGHVLAEEPDQMLCYQAAVCFFSRTAPFAVSTSDDH